MPIEEAKNHQESAVQAPNTVPMPITSNGNGFSVVQYPVAVAPVMFSMQSGNPVENSAMSQTDVSNNSSPMLVRPVPCSSTMVDLNLRHQVPVEPSPLSLRLSLSSGQVQPSAQASAFQMMPGFKNGDSIISVV